jgi:hypothetical protein
VGWDAKARPTLRAGAKFKIYAPRHFSFLNSGLSRKMPKTAATLVTVQQWGSLTTPGL